MARKKIKREAEEEPTEITVSADLDQFHILYTPDVDIGTATPVVSSIDGRYSIVLVTEDEQTEEDEEPTSSYEVVDTIDQKFNLDRNAEYLKGCDDTILKTKPPTASDFANWNMCSSYEHGYFESGEPEYDEWIETGFDVNYVSGEAIEKPSATITYTTTAEEPPSGLVSDIFYWMRPKWKEYRVYLEWFDGGEYSIPIEWDIPPTTSDPVTGSATFKVPAFLTERTGYSLTSLNVVGSDLDMEVSWNDGSKEWNHPQKFETNTVKITRFGDVFVVPSWEGEKVTVKFFDFVFDESGEQGDEYDPNCKEQYFHIGEEGKLNPCPFVHPGYLFVGWARYPYSSHIVYKDGDIFLPYEYLVKRNNVFELYAVWRKEAVPSGDAEMCIVGYDPLPVVFRDMSVTRSFPTGYWRWDFGDSVIFGCDTRGITAYEDAKNATIAYDDEVVAKISAFRLPSDKYLCDMTSDDGNEFKNIVAGFWGRLDACTMKLDFYDGGNGESYHYSNSITTGDSHFTGIFMSTVDGTLNGDGFGDVVPGEGKQKRVRYIPNTTYSSPVNISATVKGAILPDQCGRNLCEYESLDFRDSIMHVYKGPGVYYATMTCSSEKTLQGMDADDVPFKERTVSSDAQKERIEGCYINVLPVCPCVNGFRVFGANADHDKFITITADDYSCESSNFASSTAEVGYNCYVVHMDDSGKMVKQVAVSGYAPFMHVAASGHLSSRSLPVSGGMMDWGDWFTDYMAKDHTYFGKYLVGGWPTWERAGEITDANAGRLNPTGIVSGDHVYTMPGLYSIGISPEFDTETIRRFMPTVGDYEDCVEETLRRCTSSCCVLVVELPPQITGEPYNGRSDVFEMKYDYITQDFPTVVYGMQADVKAGSYPISRMDWDFDYGDPATEYSGRGKDTISISTEGFYQNNKDVKDNKITTKRKLVQYRTPTTSAYLRPFSDASTPCDGYLVGANKQSYLRKLAKDWRVDHTYRRTSFDDHPGGYFVSCSAYAENTNTCVSAVYHVLPFGGGLPEFKKEEGMMEMVDIRTDQTYEVNMVFQNTKPEDTRLYVNRVFNEETAEES